MYSIIENNDDFIIINKNCDIGFHSEDGKPGIFAIVKAKENFKELYPVHRLDKVTSGLLLFAKNKYSCTKLSALFESKEIKKYYIAISNKKPKKNQGLIIGDMVKSRRKTWKLTKDRTNPAITRFKSFPISQELRLFLLKPQTGKTHQIRVALKSLGSPVIGDPVYYASSLKEYNRAYLHSFAIKFTLYNEEYFYTCQPEQGSFFKAPSVINTISNLDLF